MPRPPSARRRSAPVLLDQLLADPDRWQPRRWPAARATPFLSEAKRQLVTAAKALGLRRGEYKLETLPAGDMHAGEVFLRGSEIGLKVSPSPVAAPPAANVSYWHRRRRGLFDRTSAADLLDPDAFAARVRRRLLLDREAPR